MLAEGRLEEAHALLQRAVHMHQRFPDAWCDLGACLRRMSRPGPAQEALHTAVTQNPKHVRVCAGGWGMRVSRARCYEENKE